MPEIRHRVGLGNKRADDLRRLWRGTGISRKRKIELVDSLIGSVILYSLETLNITEDESNTIDAAQRRLYRRALDLAPPFVAIEKGQEIVFNNELLAILGRRKIVPWSFRVKKARVRLLLACRSADEGEPIRSVLFEPNSLTPREWPGRRLPVANFRRGNWLATAYSNQAELTHR